MSRVKNFIEKADEMKGIIPSEYQITVSQIAEIANERSDFFGMITTAFDFGYLQGTKVAERKLKSKPEKEPKYKNELREAIYYHVSQTKNVYVLRRLLKVVDIFRRLYDDIEYKTVTDIDSMKASIINGVISCEKETEINRLHAFVTSFLRKH